MTIEQPQRAAAPDAPRRYAGAEDLARFIEFASRSTKERGSLRAQWHPGDVVWQLNGMADQAQPIRFWFGPDGVEVAACVVSAEELWIEATPAGEPRVAEAVEAAEARVRARHAKGGSGEFSVIVSEHDSFRIRTLERLGYRKGAPSGVGFTMDLERPPPAPEAPPGFSVRDSVGVDPALRATAHRAAWSHLEHLRIHGESQFSTDRYLSLAAMPVYDPTLDMLVVAPDGSLVANCIAWADADSGVAVFEPVGTALAYRGRRLTGLMMGEAVRRLKAKGMREARVGTAHFNASAIAAYRAAGFMLAARLHRWTKSLAQDSGRR
ncbi:MAG: GNAT family N-acetyltransferase [Caulobacteraceae bacterium]